MRSWWLPLCVLLVPAPVAAGIRGDVARHVSSELKRTEDDSASRASPPPPENTSVVVVSADAAASTTTTTTTSAEPDDPFVWPFPTVAGSGVTLLGRRAHLDLTVETALQTWAPAQHPSVRIDSKSYPTLTLAVRGALPGVVSIRRLSFETDGRSWFRSTTASASTLLGPSGVAQAVAMVGVPLLLGGLGGDLEPVVRYQGSAFATRATPTGSVCLVARNADTDADPPDCTRTDAPLQMTSSFESLMLGLAYGSEDGPGSIHGGLDAIAQRKPYQVNVDGRTLDDYLFDARFRGLGAALGFHVGSNTGPRVAAGVRLGLTAHASLTDDLGLESVPPDGWNLTYTRWEVEASYGAVLWRGPPVLLLRCGVEGSGSHFNYVHEDLVESPSVSRDLFFGVRMALLVLL